MTSCLSKGPKSDRLYWHFLQDLRQIDQELLDKVEEQSRCDLDAEVIEKLLAKHQQEENQLLQKRQLEKQRMKQKMEERLRERQKTQEKLEEAEAAKEDVSLNEVPVLAS